MYVLLILNLSFRKAPVDILKAKNHVFRDWDYEVTSKELCLYALGVGADADVGKTEDLKFVYENADEFGALPTFAVIPAGAGLMQFGEGIEGMPFNPMMLLHGEQYFEYHAPMPTSGTLKSKAKLTDILDKGKGALVVLEVVTTDARNRKICTNQFSLFIRGIGGFGGSTTPSASSKSTVPVPAGPPCAVLRDTTSLRQAALYRLSGNVTLSSSHHDLPPCVFPQLFLYHLI